MKGYSFKIGGRFVNFAEDKKRLEAILETMGYTNYKEPGSRDLSNFVEPDRIGSSPHWGRNDEYGQVLEVSMGERVRSMSLLDIVSELETFESVTFERFPVNMVKVTLTRAEDADVNPGWADSSVLPADHHCDPERLVDVIRHLRERIANS